MGSVVFDDLVAIYRNTRFGANGGGVLKIADVGIADTLHTIESDDRAYDDAQLSLADPQKIAVGDEVQINVAAPKLSLGILAPDFEALFKAPGAIFAEPSAYYVVDPGYAHGDTPVPELLIRYRALLGVTALLRDAASYVDEVQTELVFIGAEKVVIPIQFSRSELHEGVVEQSSRLKQIFSDPLHGEEKAGLLAAAVIQLVAGQRLARRFRYLVANLDRVCDEVEKGYRLFASSFSYSKIRNEVETARLDYVNKIHKTIVDIQGQLLGIPVATIVVVSQMKHSNGCDLEFWTNTGVLLGAWIFFFLLILAVTNQWYTLSAISAEVKGQRLRLADDYAAVSDQFDDIFKGLQMRVRWHRKVLGVVIAVALLGVVLATVAYLMLCRQGSAACLMPWR